jgi:hypothetical protein
LLLGNRSLSKQGRRSSKTAAKSLAFFMSLLLDERQQVFA